MTVSPPPNSSDAQSEHGLVPPPRSGPGSKPPGRPRLFNGSTRHGLLGDLTLRHPWDIPLFGLAAVFTIIVNLLWIAAVIGAIYLAATGQWDDVMGDSFGGGADATDPYGTTATFAQIFILVGALPWILWIARAIMYAQMRANGVRMTPTQFPEGYKMVAEAAQQFGMRRVPDAYVVSGNGLINAFAAGHGFRRYVVVFSDLFEVGGRARDPEALRFVIAHEVGHHAAGHTGYLRLIFSNLFMQVPILGKALTRAQEYSADNYGFAHVPSGAPGTIALLAGGKYLNAHVNVHEIADRAATEKGLWLHIVNWSSTHPIITWRAHALRDRSRAGRLWLRPKTRIFDAALPAGSTFSGPYPTPEEALSLIDAARASGHVLDEEQFGRFPFGQSYPDPQNMRGLQVRAPGKESSVPLVSRKPGRQ